MNEPTVLLTNHGLADRAGSELYTRDVARELMVRGLRPMVYSTRLGAVAAELSDLGIPVVDRLADLPDEPDLIHGHHHLEAMTAMLTFPRTPAVYVCHGTHPAEEYPPSFPSIRRYIAVSNSTRHRIHSACAIPTDRITVLPNFVDVRRFPMRERLPTRPQHLLIVDNTATWDNFGGLIARTAEQRGFTVRMIGKACGSPVADLAGPLTEADVVVAMGRTALEAMATGCVVLVAGEFGLGGMVTRDRFAKMQAANFGREALVRPLERTGLLAEIDQYDPDDAAAVQLRVRAEAGLARAVDRLQEVYAAVLAEPYEFDPDAATAAAAGYLEQQSELIRAAAQLGQERDELREQVRLTAEQAARSAAEREAVAAQLLGRTGVRGASAALARDFRLWLKRRVRRG